jgi:hypothetical protein
MKIDEPMAIYRYRLRREILDSLRQLRENALLAGRWDEFRRWDRRIRLMTEGGMQDGENDHG